MIVVFAILLLMYPWMVDAHYLTCGTPEPERRIGPAMISDGDVRRHVRRVFGHESWKGRRHNRKLGISVEERSYNRRLGVYEVVIPVWFHAVTDAANSKPTVTEAQCDKEILDLNSAFSGWAISFVKASYGLSANDAFYDLGCDSAEEEMKEALAVDPTRYLNMYYTDCQTHGLFGFASFPWNIDPQYAEDSYMQGVVNDVNSVAGGDACGDVAPCEGDTAKHEIGHYLGLYHTFQDGCDFKNDYVADTPSTAQPNYGTCGDPDNPSDDPEEIEAYCPDSCDDGDGCDMQYNLMDYADDHCLSTFTEGQAFRMLYYLATGRETMVSGWGYESADAVDNCVAGSYFNIDANAECELCPQGKYNAVHGCDRGADCCTDCPGETLHASYGTPGWAYTNSGSTNVYECYDSCWNAVGDTTPDCFAWLEENVTCEDFGPLGTWAGECDISCSICPCAGEVMMLHVTDAWGDGNGGSGYINGELFCSGCFAHDSGLETGTNSWGQQSFCAQEGHNEMCFISDDYPSEGTLQVLYASGAAVTRSVYMLDHTCLTFTVGPTPGPSSTVPTPVPSAGPSSISGPSTNNTQPTTNMPSAVPSPNPSEVIDIFDFVDSSSSSISVESSLLFVAASSATMLLLLWRRRRQRLRISRVHTQQQRAY